ncbi:entry exclusion lipoprotein TrbK [Escherichia coli]|jgi:entry exclusion lipoprotein TrbK|uniref:Entry exclusion lipoprotein TrbK n=1 Tax=Enterobacter hormaechei subsp. xiangfangensis TaxID=1296536 RepID=A0A6F8V6N2_9ENTR|nr:MULTISPECIES: entry exclusion lipoprotein TrbK [Enterobacteriaceae]EAA4229944.1 entry exclusion lipoprotein TrbK [Salmonella enterica subsp. enterica serovar Newport]EAB5633844.1 entry exclusion lipoprotein TrbK [Salmonella enterica subsp. enterica serovar Typhimurium]EAM2543160.1 entry exclusion lipoprotein TrbK [Salmonella enterica]EBG7958464.1 entry exclusion lipoprotein TrbK [Salmonella enterica subsp. enterica serovar Heidelberg]ECE6100814.1 entry exclusion lipoprotein TrbK [Salmonella
MKYIIPLILSAFFITACDQKTDPNQVDCNKAVSKMTDQEKTQCGKSGEFTKSPEKKW